MSQLRNFDVPIEKNPNELVEENLNVSNEENLDILNEENFSLLILSPNSIPNTNHN